MLKRLFLIILVVVIAGGFYLVRYHLPDQHDPFAPLLIDSPPGLATSFKLKRIENSPKMCFETLRQSNLKYERLSDQETGENCGFFNAVRLQQSSISYGGNISLTCPAMVALAMWEQHELQPLANEIFGQDVIRVRHFGTYACRNINNSRSGRRSEHAVANAIDIAGFVLADGSEVSVLKDWDQASDKSNFLQALHGSACRYFSTVLGPEYNTLHHNHFHMDMGFFQICR